MEEYGLILKSARSEALATLIRILGDIDLAEDAIQEASYRALIDWPEKAIPENPSGWLIQTGRRFALDRLRHGKMAQRKLQGLAPLHSEAEVPDDDLKASALQQHDDQLRLIFICCHPLLALEAQVALTLKIVAGLDIEEIARAYLLPVTTLQRRLSRAKLKIRESGVAYAVPDDRELENRLAAVLRVIYLIYNQAYTTLKGEELFSPCLSEAAIYLARVLNRLMRDQPEAMGLLALLLLQHSRAAARSDESGLPVSLEQQDRSRWDSNLIRQANVMLEKCDRHWQPGPYQIQAAIAAVHCNAASSADTDWQEIVDLYGLLEHQAASPVVTLNRAIAVAELSGPEAGLELLDKLQQNPQIGEFQYYHSARAALFERIGETAMACEAFERAISLCRNDAERRYLQGRIRHLSN